MNQLNCLGQYDPNSRSLISVSVRCTEGHGFQTPVSTQLFSLSYALDMMNIHLVTHQFSYLSSSFITALFIY